ncbi:DinB family protein [Lapillicoccus sp.]|uniref:DinB family protein n=1 Tax=Lapillicoccus sp. TaxID=1909287 RepID=UPI0025F377A3|nr:DinB family protein [Lapillicoccus sp.]
MPGNPPPVATEHEALRAFLAQQHDGIRGAAYGLTDEQAHATPSSSAITIAGLVKHVTVMERGWLERALAAPDVPAADTRPFEEQMADYGQDWDPAGQRIEDLLADFDAMATASEDAIADLDLDAPVPVPQGAPWFPRDIDAWSVRWVLFHIIEEVARHAGHGDIVRESLDGATMYELLAGREGWPATAWLTPWAPPTA